MDDEGRQFKLIYLRSREQINEGENSIKGRVQRRRQKPGLSQINKASCFLLASCTGFCTQGNHRRLLSEDDLHFAEIRLVVM